MDEDMKTLYGMFYPYAEYDYNVTKVYTNDYDEHVY